MFRVYGVLVLVDVLVAVGWWRRWLTMLATTVGAGLVWIALAFAVTVTSEVSGANMAALWFLVGPLIVGCNSAVAAGVEQLGRAARR
jgi:hypothetical protein